MRCARNVGLPAVARGCSFFFALAGYGSNREKTRAWRSRSRLLGCEGPHPAGHTFTMTCRKRSCMRCARKVGLPAVAGSRRRELRRWDSLRLAVNSVERLLIWPPCSLPPRRHRAKSLILLRTFATTCRIRSCMRCARNVGLSAVMRGCSFLRACRLWIKLSENGRSTIPKPTPRR